jgi:hypothetical protein
MFRSILNLNDLYLGTNIMGKIIKNELNKTSKIPKTTFKKQVLIDFYNLLIIIDIIVFIKINCKNINRHQITRN